MSNFDREFVNVGNSNSSFSSCDFALTMAHQLPLIVSPIYTTLEIRGLMKDMWLEHNEATAYFKQTLSELLDLPSLFTNTSHAITVAAMQL